MKIIILALLAIISMSSCMSNEISFKYAASSDEAKEMQNFLKAKAINFRKALKKKTHSKEMVKFNFSNGFLQQYSNEIILIDGYSADEIVIQVMGSGSIAIIDCMDCVNLIRRIKGA